jgi:hypothetical protein
VFVIHRSAQWSLATSSRCGGTIDGWSRRSLLQHNIEICDEELFGVQLKIVLSINRAKVESLNDCRLSPLLLGNGPGLRCRLQVRQVLREWKSQIVWQSQVRAIGEQHIDCVVRVSSINMMEVIVNPRHTNLDTTVTLEHFAD